LFLLFSVPWQAKILHYGSISLITEPCKSAHIAAAKAAKNAGVVLSYDPNLRLPLWPSAESAREGILSIWDTADIIKVSTWVLFGNCFPSPNVHTRHNLYKKNHSDGHI
jgi:sugar/nucleoside kinase (ribokinase family)